MTHPQSSRTSFRCANPLKGAHPAARQSRFRGCSRMACSAAIGVLSHGDLLAMCNFEEI
jgi:hypothetical protein